MRAGNPEVPPCGGRRDPPSGGTREQTDPDQEGLHDRLDRLRFLSDRDGEGVQADRSPVEPLQDRVQDGAVEAVQSCL